MFNRAANGDALAGMRQDCRINFISVADSPRMAASPRRLRTDCHLSDSGAYLRRVQTGDDAVLELAERVTGSTCLPRGLSRLALLGAARERPKRNSLTTIRVITNGGTVLWNDGLNVSTR